LGNHLFCCFGHGSFFKDVLYSLVEVHLAEMSSIDYTGWMHLVIGFTFIGIGELIPELLEPVLEEVA